MQKLDNNQSVTDNVQVALDWITQGKLIAYPTESVWGLGCNPFDEWAVRALLTLKNRPIEKGLIVLTASQAYITDFLANLPSQRQQQIVKSWAYDPNIRQATTWLLNIPPHTTIPHWVRGEHSSLAIRVINHASIAKLCELVATNGLNPYGFLVSTSCNPSNLPPAKTLAQAQSYFGEQVGYFVGETLHYENPSQILDGRTGQAVRL